MSGVLAKLDNTFIPDAESRNVTHLQTVVNVPKIIFDYLMDAVQAVRETSLKPVHKNTTYPHVMWYFFLEEAWC